MLRKGSRNNAKLVLALAGATLVPWKSCGLPHVNAFPALCSFEADGQAENSRLPQSLCTSRRGTCSIALACFVHLVSCHPLRFECIFLSKETCNVEVQIAEEAEDSWPSFGLYQPCAVVRIQG